MQLRAAVIEKKRIAYASGQWRDLGGRGGQDVRRQARRARRSDAVPPQ